MRREHTRQREVGWVSASFLCAVGLGMLLPACGNSQAPPIVDGSSAAGGNTSPEPQTGGATSVGTTDTGGLPDTGGTTGAAGTTASGGTPVTGGSITPDASAAPGGSSSTGGVPSSGGVPNSGGVSKTGGVPSSGGVSSAGGSSGGVVVVGSGMRGLAPKEIVKDMFLGWNLGNTFDSTSGGETGWGNPVTTQAMIDQVKSGGFKTVRIPVTWQSQLGAAPTYTINKTFLDRVETVVNYVLKDGMYAIVNTHHDGWYKLATASQDQGVAETTAVWSQIATRFKDYSDYLILETFNEPHGSVNAYGGGNAEQQTVLNAYHLAAVNAIRATGGNNAQRIVMVCTHGASPVEAAAKALVIPNNDPNIIISVHTYYPTGFGLNGSPTTWGAGASDYTAMGASLDQILGWWPDRGIVIGEWGSVSKDQLDSRVKHAKAYTQDVTKRGMCPVWWDNGGSDFGLLNRKANPPTWTYPTIVSNLVAGSTAGSAPGAVDATMP